MHILYLHQYFCPPGGSGNDRSLQFSRHWVRAGHTVTVITSDAYFPEGQKAADGKPRAIALEPGLEVHVLPVAYSHHMGFARRVRSWLHFYRVALRHARALAPPSLIYASSTPLTVGELGRVLHQHWQVPFVYETVDVWPDVPIGMGVISNPLVIATANRRTQRIYDQAAAIVALSEGMRDQILSHGVPPGKVSVIHNGTDPAAFACGPRTARPLVKALYAGTVGKANDLTLLLDAMRILEGQGSPIHLQVVGGGNDLDRVKAHAQQLGLRQVEFMAPVPKEQVPALLQEADIGVVCFGAWPVLEANSANKFYDYLAAGLPVVTNYEGWQASYLREFSCGLSAPQGDSARLAANLSLLASDHRLREEMGRNGQQLAAQRFDRKHLAAALLDLFGKVLAP